MCIEGLHGLQVALMDHDQGKDANNWRTSTQHWLSGRIPTVNRIQQRAEALLKVFTAP